MKLPDTTEYHSRTPSTSHMEVGVKSYRDIGTKGAAKSYETTGFSAAGLKVPYS